MPQTQQEEKTQWFALIYFWSSCLSLFVFPVGTLLPSEIYKTTIEFAFMPFWIPIIGIIAQPEYQPTVVLSAVWALTPAIGNSIYTATALLVVNYVFRGVQLDPRQRRYCGRLRTVASLFIVVVAIYGLADMQR